MYTRVCTLLVGLLSAVKKSEPLSRHAYVISVEALPCSAPNRSRLTCSGSPCVCVCDVQYFKSIEVFTGVFSSQSVLVNSFILLSAHRST